MELVLRNFWENHAVSPYVIAKFFQGVSDQNENLVGKFFAPGAQKRGSQIFRLRRAFFVVEALKTAKKPLKTAKNG